jgi:tRNA threonylcarbamoyladenosine biosynthesis protein TsaB
MIFLVTDTSGRNGTVALARADTSQDAVEVIETAPLTGGSFSAQLVPQIDTLLKKHGLGKTDLDAFLVVSGPGSFTGLRVGLAAIKALAEILDKPIVPVSLLELVALAAATQGTILAVLDAGRGELYAGEYEVTGDSAELHSERLLSKDQFLSTAPDRLISTPDKTLAEFARQAGLRVHEFQGVTTEMIGKLGLRKLRAGEVVSSDQLEANYGRRSDAEIFAKTGSK